MTGMSNGAATGLIEFARREAELATLDALIEANEADDSGLAQSLLKGYRARRASLMLQLIAAVVAA